jgi:hypothetical protein
MSAQTKEPDIVDQIRVWYGYDAAFRPIGEAAIAEITRLRAERPGWRTMESAPKDGTKVDLLYRGDIRRTDAFWKEDAWWFGDDDDCFTTTGKACPTHWMPLPTPPAPGK